MRIRVKQETPLHHVKAGFQAWAPGEYDFPDDVAFAGWLEGHVASGVVEILPPPEPEPLPEPEPEPPPPPPPPQRNPPPRKGRRGGR